MSVLRRLTCCSLVLHWIEFSEVQLIPRRLILWRDKIVERCLSISSTFKQAKLKHGIPEFAYLHDAGPAHAASWAVEQKLVLQPQSSVTTWHKRATRRTNKYRTHVRTVEIDESLEHDVSELLPAARRPVVHVRRPVRQQPRLHADTRNKQRLMQETTQCAEHQTEAKNSRWRTRSRWTEAPPAPRRLGRRRWHPSQRHGHRASSSAVAGGQSSSVSWCCCLRCCCRKQQDRARRCLVDWWIAELLPLLRTLQSARVQCSMNRCVYSWIATSDDCTAHSTLCVCALVKLCDISGLYYRLILGCYLWTMRAWAWAHRRRDKLQLHSFFSFLWRHSCRLLHFSVR